eukprot:c45700_g1_i1 orf=129-290(+)
MGHLNYESLKELSIKEMVRGLPYIVESSHVYEACIMDWQQRDAFLKKGKESNT